MSPSRHGMAVALRTQATVIPSIDSTEDQGLKCLVTDGGEAHGSPSSGEHKARRGLLKKRKFVVMLSQVGYSNFTD